MFADRTLAGGELEARLTVRAGELETLAGEEFETLDDLRSGLFDLSRVEDSEDLSRVEDRGDFSRIDSFRSESPDFRWGSLRRSTVRPESPPLSRTGASLLTESRRVSIFRCVSRERTASLVWVLRSTVRSVPPIVRWPP